MLTLDSILAVTRQQAAYGELPTQGVPRDRGGRPGTAHDGDIGASPVKTPAPETNKSGKADDDG